MPEMLKFENAQSQPNIIKVIGVGGGGSNAVTHMFTQGIKGVDFVICNTDAQALEKSPIPTKIHLGKRNLGAGNIPSVGKQAALETVEELRSLFDEDTKMLFITAGMGGGTGTGAAPVVASVAKELGILTVGIVTLPFAFEGRRRNKQALEGLDEMRNYVDTLLIISNDKLRYEYGNMRLTEAFQKADDVLTTAAKGIAEIITVTGYINVDFEDVNTVMRDSGKAIMGSAKAEGEQRAMTAIEEAMHSPLLNDSNIAGAKNILLYITSGTEEVSLDEVHEITEYVQTTCGNTAELIWGNGIDESLGNSIGITIIATGFNNEEEDVPVGNIEVKKVFGLDGKSSTRETTPSLFRNFEKDVPARQNVRPVTIHSLDGQIKETAKEKTVEEPEFEGFKIEPLQTRIFEKSHPAEQKTVEQTGEVKESSKPTIHFLEEDKSESKEQSFAAESELSVSDELQLTSYIKEAETEEKEDVVDSEIKITSLHKVEEIQEIVDEDEQIEKQAKIRQERLKALSMKIQTEAGLEEMEHQPAYMRRGISLNKNTEDETPELSSYTVSKEENKSGLKTDNSYIHKEVD